MDRLKVLVVAAGMFLYVAVADMVQFTINFVFAVQSSI